jgi:subtilase family serine protease
MMLQLKRSPVLESELVQYIGQLTDKSSPNFHHWLTAQQLGEKYGLAQSDLDTIKSWLQSHGFTVDRVYPNRMVIAFSGTAGMIRNAFHTEIHYLEVNGQSHYANMGDTRIPAALAPAVVGVVSMHNFKPHAHSILRTDYTVAAGTYSLVPADFQMIYNLNPVFRQGIHGEGQTIAVVEDSDTYGADVATYRSTFLPQYSGTVVTTHPGGCTDPGTNAADGEADLDAEVASAIAPNATIQVATCADTTTFGGLIAIQNMLASSPPHIISMSYGECEVASTPSTNAAFFTAFQAAAALGVSVFVSSGDAGASGCAPDFFTGASLYAYPGIGITGWGETPYNVSVGGTDFEDEYNALKPANGGLPQSTYWNATNNPAYGSALSYIPEIPWNDSCASYLIANLKGFATTYGTAGFCNSSTATTNNAFLTTAAAAGGPSNCATGNAGQPLQDVTTGTCAGYAKPSWQSGIFGNPTDGVRDIPDVSLFASNGIWGHYAVVCFSDTTNGGKACSGAPSTWSGFGGTSVATPMMAGIQSLVNQHWGTAWTGGAFGGNPAPTYYSIANAEFGGSGNSNCYSINQPAGRRGLGTACTFYDVTQGDIDVNCRTNGSITSNCYHPTGTNGVLSTGQVTSVVASPGGSGYTAAPTCTIVGPSNKSSYISPQGTTLWAGGTQATCTATVASTTSKSTSTANANAGYLPGAGTTMTVGAITYTWVTTLTAANQVTITGMTTELQVAQNMEAALNANAAQCGIPTGGPCFGPGTVANPAVTVAITSARLTLTAVNNGCAVVPFDQNDSGYGVNPFIFSTNTGYLGGGALPGQICAYTVTAGGTGYQGNPTCTVSGGTGGTGAGCQAINGTSTAPVSYQPAFGATPGWDFATGLGSVNAYNLVFNTAW